MLVYKNKHTGRYFIYLSQTGSDEALLVTPPNNEGKVRIISLELEFFEEPEELEEKFLLSKDLITKKQTEKYHQNRDWENEKIVQGFLDAFKATPKWKIKEYKEKGGDMAEIVKLVEQLIAE